MNCWLDKSTNSKTSLWGCGKMGRPFFWPFLILRIIVVAALVCTHFSRSSPSLYICFPCFFLQDHPGPPLSLLPLRDSVCHSPSFHPSFFYLNLSQGDLGRAHLLSSPSPSIPCEISEVPFLSWNSPVLPSWLYPSLKLLFSPPLPSFFHSPSAPIVCTFPQNLLIIPVQFFIFPVIFPPVRLPCLLSPLLNSIYSLIRSYMRGTAFNPCILKLKTKETRPRLQSLPIPSLLSLATLCCQCFSRCSAVASTTHINLSSVYGCKCTGSKLWMHAGITHVHCSNVVHVSVTG